MGKSSKTFLKEHQKQGVRTGDLRLVSIIVGSPVLKPVLQTPCFHFSRRKETAAKHIEIKRDKPKKKGCINLQ